MSAQRFATGLGLAGLTGLLVWVGLPALAQPPAVPVIQISEPAAPSPDDASDNKPVPDPPASPGDDDDDAGDDADDGGGARPGDDGGGTADADDDDDEGDDEGDDDDSGEDDD